MTPTSLTLRLLLPLLIVAGCSTTPVGNDAGPTHGGDTGTPSEDTGTPSEDTGTAADPLVGTWVSGPTTATGTAMQETTYTYTFAADGTYTWNRHIVYPEGTGAVLAGCTRDGVVSGTYVSASLMITPTMGTSEITGATCGGTSASMPIPGGDPELMATTAALSGTMLTVNGEAYTKQ